MLVPCEHKSHPQDRDTLSVRSISTFVSLGFAVFTSSRFIADRHFSCEMLAAYSEHSVLVNIEGG